MRVCVCVFCFLEGGVSYMMLLGNYSKQTGDGCNIQ